MIYREKTSADHFMADKKIWIVTAIYLKGKYTQFHLTVKMKDETKCVKREFLKSSLYNRNRDVYNIIWYTVASWACEVTVILTQKRLHQCFFV